MHKGQLGWSVRAFYNRCQVCNQSIAIMDLMMIANNVTNFVGNFCLPKGRHSEGPHEIHPISSQNCSRGGVGWGRAGVGWGGVA